MAWPPDFTIHLLDDLDHSMTACGKKAEPPEPGWPRAERRLCEACRQSALR